MPPFELSAGVNSIMPATSLNERAVPIELPAVATGTFSLTWISASPPAGTVTEVELKPIVCGGEGESDEGAGACAGPLVPCAVDR